MNTLLFLDIQILDFIQAHLRTAWLDVFLPFISALGNGGFIWLLFAVILLCLPRHRRKGLFVILGLFLGFILVSVLLKPLCARPRPSWGTDILLLIANPEDFSFPSGHTASSFIFAFILSRYFPHLRVALFSGASLMAFSRLYLYVHYPSDVLFSILLAFFVSRIVFRIARKYAK